MQYNNLPTIFIIHLRVKDETSKTGGKIIGMKKFPYKTIYSYKKSTRQNGHKNIA